MATLQVQTREQTRSADVRRLRSQGILPIALIVKGEGTKLVQAPAKDVRAVLSGSAGSAVFGVSLGGDAKPIQVILKDLQRDSISRKVIHATFQEVRDDEVIRFSVPVIVDGEPDCVTKKRSSLQVNMTNLEIFAKPADIPESIHLDVSQLKDHDKIVVGDIKLPNGVTTHLPEDAVVVTTIVLRAVSLEAPSAEAAAPAEGEAAPAAAEPAKKA